MKRIIKLEKLDNDSVIIESKDEFAHSMFEQVYQKAEVLLTDIVKKSNAEKMNEKKSGGKGIYQTAYIENIISFDGKRGTGKTSAMLSFLQMLREHRGAHAFLKDKELGDTSFVVLDYVDASTLEKGEDILKIILANMFYQMTQYRNNDSQKLWSYEERELRKKFDSIYADYKRINSAELSSEDVSPLKELMQLSNSQMLRNEIANFVKEYLNYMQNVGGISRSNGNPFLIIAIDDLDMGFQRGTSTAFELLETLHRYFMIPGVVIMLTYNYEDLLYGCEGHFSKIFNESKHNLDELRQNYVEDLTNQYLRKILPTYSRVYMPAMDSIDTLIEIPISVVDSEDVLKAFRNTLISRNMGECVTISVKKFVMLMIASVTGIYCNGLGDKQHFLEPTTLRELSQMYVFYKQLEKEKSKKEVFKNLLDNLRFYKAKTTLKMKEDEIFSKYLSVRIERRSKDILSNVRPNRVKNSRRLIFELSTRDAGENLSYCGNAEMSYSYGELLYWLFEAKKEGMYSSELISCILNAYNIELTEFYQMWKEQKDALSYKRLSSVLGSSVSSSWSCKFLPKVQKTKIIEVNNKESQEENKVSVETNYVVDPEASAISVVAAVKFDNSGVYWPFKLVSDKNTIGAQIRTFEMLCMFFTEVYFKDEDGFKTQGFDIEYKSQKGEESPFFNVKISSGCFNVMNFVNNSLDAENFFGQLHERMFFAVKEWFNDYYQLWGRKKVYSDEEITKLINKYSLKGKYTEWAKKTAGFSMPIYSVDIMYNLFKRYDKIYGPILEYVAVDRFLFVLMDFYKSMGELLKGQDEFYFSDVNGDIKPEEYCFFDKYVSTPFLEEIHEMMVDEKKRKVFKEHFDFVIELIANLNHLGNGLGYNYGRQSFGID